MALIYLDTCLLIYAVEGDDSRAESVRTTLRSHGDDAFAISQLVEFECLVKPHRAFDFDLVDRYERAFEHFEQLAIGRPVFRRAAHLRAHFGLSAPDALHVAAAKLGGCDALWTNDGRLKKAAPGFAVVIAAE